MAFEKVSYKDPKVRQIAEAMEAKYGLPGGLLVDIITKGERTDHDKVSEDRARGVAQIIPSTRKGILEQTGIDPYASLENNIEGAAYLLKQNLDRTGGNVPEAVAAYHGGWDKSRRGPINRDYVKRVTGRSAASVPRAAQPVAKREQGPPVVPQRVIAALESGEMSPSDEAALRKALAAKQVVLSQGVTLPAPTRRNAKSDATVIPPRVIANYNSHSDMTDGQRDLIDRDIAEGLLTLPPGAKLQRPAPRTAGEMLGMGVRNIAEGGGALVDIVAAPLNATVNTVAGTNLSTTPGRDAGAAISDAFNLAKPGTPGEKLAGSIIEGATQGLATAGIGGLAAGAPGVAGTVARGVAGAPIVDTVASGAATGAQEAARQAGADPLVQFGAALAAGGAAGAGAAGAARRVAPAIVERIGPRAAKVIEETPSEVLVDEAGELTEDGVEAAIRAKAQPEEFKAAVQQFRQAINDNAAVAREAGQPPPQDVAVGQSEVVDVMTPRRRGSTMPEEPPVVARAAEVAAEPVPAATEAPRGPVAARVAEAEELGVPLTRGQATQDFARQADEQALLAASTPEGQAARDFKVRQQEALQSAVTRFRETLGDTAATPEQRGAALKEALETMRDQGKAGVAKLYETARQTAEEIGQNAGSNVKAVLQLDTGAIKARVREILLDATVDKDVRSGVRQEAARYGLIGENPRTFEDGTSSVTVRAGGGPDAPTRTITFDGAPEPLSIANAETFRKKLNAMFDKDRAGALTGLKGMIDDAVTDAVERVAREFDGTPDNVGQQFKAARAAHQQQQRTFSSKDVVAKLLANRKGTETPEIPASRAVKALLDGPVEDLRKAKAIILSSKDPVVKAGWEGVRAQAIADLFDKAWTMNANAGGGMIGQLSGAKLRSEIARVGAPKLKVLLGEEDFNQLMKIQRVAGDATIPISGTVNSSGTAGALLRFFGKQANRLSPLLGAVPGVGAVKAVADVGASVVKGAQEAAKSKAVLEGVQNFTPEAAQAVDAAALAPERARANPVKFISDYLAAAKSERLVAPLVAATASQETDQ